MQKFSINESRHFHNLQPIFLKEFVNVIYSYVKSIQNLQSADPPVDPQPLKGALGYALRLFTGTHATFVSESVLMNIELKKLNENPFSLNYEKRNKMGTRKWRFKNGESREMSFAVWEHANTVKDMISLLITLDNKDDVADALKKYPGVAWISRTENEKLNEKGYSKTRPGGALKCYKEVGITLFNREMYSKSSYYKKPI